MNINNNIVEKIYILGAGSMARETFSICKDLSLESRVEGFIEDKPHTKFLHGKKIFETSELKTFSKRSVFIVAIGSFQRKNMVKKIKELGFTLQTIIHPSAIMGDSVALQKGCIICPEVVMTCNISIGENTIINTNSTINHDSIIGNFVTIGPGVNIAGNVTIGENCWIGIGVTIIEKAKIGEGSFIGAGAVVVENIEPYTLAYGVPAKPIKKLTHEGWQNLLS